MPQSLLSRDPAEDAPRPDIQPPEPPEPHVRLKPFGLQDEALRSLARQSAAALMDEDGAKLSRKSSLGLCWSTAAKRNIYLCKLALDDVMAKA